MQAKLSKTFVDQEDHIDVQNPDGVGQQVRIFVVSDQFKKMMVRLVEIKEPRYTMELPKVNYSNLQDVSNFRSSFLGMKWVHNV